MVHHLVLFMVVISASTVRANDILEVALDETYEWADMEKPSDVQVLQLQSLSNVLNRDADPCEDFYQFSCGNYARNNSILYRSGPINENLMLEILLNWSYMPENEAEEKAMQYFNVCVSDLPRNSSLEDVMAYLNGILQEHMTAEGFRWLEIEAFLTTINLPLLLDFSVDEDRFRLDSSAVWDLLDLNENWKPSKYIEYTQSRLSFLNLQNNSLENISRNLESFKTSLRSYIIHFIKGEESLNMSNVNVTIEELEKLLHFIDMKKYLGIVLGAEFNLTSKIEVVAPSSFKMTAEFMSQVDPRQVYDFYRWHIADKLRALADHEEDEIGTLCYHHTYLTVKSVLLSIFKKAHFHPDSEQEIKDMFERIKNEFGQLVQEAFRGANGTKLEALRKVDAITLEILFSSYILEEENLVEEYRSFQVDPSNSIRNYLNGSALQLQRSIKFMSRRKSQTDINWLDEDPLRPDPFFDEKHGGAMYLPVGLLKAPFFHPYFYRFYNYGVLGFIMGHEIVHGFDLDGIAYDSIGVERDWLSGELKNAIAESINCYREQYGNFTFLNQSIDGDATLNENIADHIGVVLAMNAYKHWLHEYDDTPALEDERSGASNLGLTELQAFFISLGYFHCAHPQFQVQAENADHAPESVRLTGLLSNSAEFSDVFRCPVKSRMNPIKKCKYFYNMCK